MKKLLFVFFLACFVFQGCGFDTATLGKKSSSLVAIPASYHGVWTGSGSCNQASYNLTLTISEDQIWFDDLWPGLNLSCPQYLIHTEVDHNRVHFRAALPASGSACATYNPLTMCNGSLVTTLHSQGRTLKLVPQGFITDAVIGFISRDPLG